MRLIPITQELRRKLTKLTYRRKAFDIANDIGVSHGTYSRWLSGKTRSLRKSVYEKVMDYLETHGIEVEPISDIPATEYTTLILVVPERLAGQIQNAVKKIVKQA